MFKRRKGGRAAFASVDEEKSPSVLAQRKRKKRKTQSITKFRRGRKTYQGAEVLPKRGPCSRSKKRRKGKGDFQIALPMRQKKKKEHSFCEIAADNGKEHKDKG